MIQMKCTDLSVGYEKKRIARGISFEVNKGDYLCIVGDNGSGKSTLMKTILRLVQPIEGKIEFLDGLSPSDIGYLPQLTEHQRDFPASVEEVVMSGCIGKVGFLPIYGRRERVMVHDNLRKLSIDGLQKKAYRELSGGQQQRVLLARALCAASKMLLLDEPVSGLDPTATSEMYKTIEALNKEGITIIMISHDIEAAIGYASHILHMGKDPLFFGTREEYLRYSERANGEVAENG